jgi:hypothetical protein
MGENVASKANRNGKKFTKGLFLAVKSEGQQKSSLKISFLI